MREVTPTRSAALELADERKLMRQGYEFLDEKRTLLATEMLRQLRLYQERADALDEAMKRAADALALAIERHGFDGVQVYPAPEAPQIPDNTRSCFSGSPCWRRAKPRRRCARRRPRSIPRRKRRPAAPRSRRCWRWRPTSACAPATCSGWRGNTGAPSAAPRRWRRCCCRKSNEAIKHVDEQLDTMEREETIRTRWAHKSAMSG